MIASKVCISASQNADGVNADHKLMKESVSEAYVEETREGDSMNGFLSLSFSCLNFSFRFANLRVAAEETSLKYDSDAGLEAVDDETSPKGMGTEVAVFKLLAT